MHTQGQQRQRFGGNTHHAATRCNTLQYAATHCNKPVPKGGSGSDLAGVHTHTHTHTHTPEPKGGTGSGLAGMVSAAAEPGGASRVRNA